MHEALTSFLPVISLADFVQPRLVRLQERDA
jgi:hypothetical protein